MSEKQSDEHLPRDNRRLYAVWGAMIRRCNNPNNGKYHNYGGRGIKVCDEWKTFKSFKNWAFENGYDPNAQYGKCSLDRIDNDGDYTPENCRWVDFHTQCLNTRRNRIISVNGVSLTATEWENMNNLTRGTIYNRVKKGWSEEDAAITPLYGRGGRKS